MSPSSKKRAAPPQISETMRVLLDLQEKPWRYDFFAAARRLEADHDGPGFGRSKLPFQDPIRFGQHASMAFSPRSIEGTEIGPVAPILKLRFSGLFGSNGALPDHLTEWAEEGRQHRNDNTLEAFADIFHHRFFSLFYRAWADSDPVLCTDNNGIGDYYEKFVGAMGGLSDVGANGFSNYGRRFFMGHIGPGAPKPEALSRVIGDIFDVNVTLTEFVGMWVDVPDEDCARLGQSSLSSLAVLGRKVWSRGLAFEIVIGPLGKERFNDFLPDGKNKPVLREIVIALVGLDLDWRVRLKRDIQSIQGTRLDGSARLGYDTWMGNVDDGSTSSRSDMLISGERYHA